MLKPLLIIATIPVLLIALAAIILLVIAGKFIHKHKNNSIKQTYFSDGDDLYNCLEEAEMKKVS